MWVHEAKAEALQIMIEHCSAMKLVSGPDGQLYYANAAFREWSEYGMSELTRIGWKQLSVENESLEADLDAVHQIKDGYIQGYTIRKQYRTKSGTAHWGNLSVIRYPASGQVEYFFCLWEPFKNGTSTAFNLALDHCNKLNTRLAEMNAELAKLTAQTDEDRYVVSTIKMIRTYPKTAAALLVFALSIFGANNVIELLQRVGLIQLPAQIQKSESETVGDLVYAHSIARVPVAKSYSVSTPGGNTIDWVQGSAGNNITMPRAANSVGRGTGGIRYGFTNSTGTSGSLSGLRGITEQSVRQF